jgi:hypothetical protein
MAIVAKLSGPLVAHEHHTQKQAEQGTAASQRNSVLTCNSFGDPSGS